MKNDSKTENTCNNNNNDKVVSPESVPFKVYHLNMYLYWEQALYISNNEDPVHTAPAQH